MKLGYRIEYGITTILFLIIINAYLYIRDTKEDLSFTEFRRLAFYALAANFFEILAMVAFSYTEIFHPLISVLLNCAYFLCMVHLTMSLAEYILVFISTKQEISYKIPLKRTLYIINLVMIAAYLCIGLAFAFDFSSLYQWKNMYFVILPIPYYFVLNALILLLRYRNLFQKIHLFTLISSLFFCIAGKLIQIFLLPDYPLTMFCVGVSIPSIMFTLETPDYKKLQMNLVELKEAREQSQLASRTKSSFLANMSHEIRSPIHAIIGISGMIDGECQKEGEKEAVREYSRDIRNAGNELLELVNGILDYSKIRSGKAEIIPVRYSLGALLADIWKEAESIYNGSEVKLHFNANPDTHEQLCGDHAKIRRILLSFINNSKKYTKKGEVWVEIFSEEKESGSIILNLTIRDTGAGIDEDNMKKLLSFLEQEEKRENYNYSGIDIDIFVCKTFTEMMGGEFTFSSVPGEGTEFRLKIPQQYFGDERIGVLQKKADTEESGNREPGLCRILLVDDTPVNLKIMESLIREIGYEVDTAKSGKDCIKMADENKYDLILMDYLMPEMNGIETLKRLREQEASPNRSTPVIMLSAGSEEEIDYKKEGFSAFMPKPVSKEKLMEKLRDYRT